MNVRLSYKIMGLVPKEQDKLYKALERSILRGTTSRTITVTKEGVVLDGFSTLEICQKHSLKFSTKVIDLVNDSEALEWVIKKQLKREDISLYMQGKLLIYLEDIIRERYDTNKCLIVDSNGKIYPKPDSLVTKESTNEQLAKLASLSHSTLSQIKTIEIYATDEQKEELSLGKTTIGALFREVRKKTSTSKSSIIENKMTKLKSKGNLSSDDESAMLLAMKYGDKLEKDLYNTDKPVSYTITDMEEELSNIIEYFTRNVRDCLTTRVDILNSNNKSIIANILTSTKEEINNIIEEHLK